MRAQPWDSVWIFENSDLWGCLSAVLIALNWEKKNEGLKYNLFGNFKNLEIIYFIYNLDFSSGIFSLKFDFFSSDFFNLRILPIFEIFMTSWFEFWKFLKICPRETIHFFFQILTTLLYHLRYYIYMEETKYIKYDIILFNTTTTVCRYYKLHYCGYFKCVSLSKTCLRSSNSVSIRSSPMVDS